ncbi:MAG: AlwI family type II restriction endonuclease [bacterium]|nr:AlwI family type II restriction endonuclease [bacterium]
MISDTATTQNLKPWHIGNTTVRTPYRLKEALIALKNSQFHGNLRGKEAELGFTRLLNEKGIVRVDRIKQQTGIDSSDLGRKWRSALAQLGFVVMHRERGSIGREKWFTLVEHNFPTLTGRPYEITPSGYRLMQAESMAEQQECFLRALTAYRIPSFFETRYDFPSFSPLHFVLDILLKLEQTEETAVIRPEEMAALVQLSNPSHNPGKVVSDILSYRLKRAEAANKRKTEDELLMGAVGGDRKKIGTLGDYADLNFRYLKATGLFQGKGRGICLIKEKRVLIDLLVAEKEERCSDTTYIKSLWQGAALPTDDRVHAIEVILDLSNQLEAHQQQMETVDFHAMADADLAQYRHKLEHRLLCLKELEYAEKQIQVTDEIIDFLKALRNVKRSVRTKEGVDLRIPSGEAPAYFEWATWRAFLAMNSLVNKPWEARRFNIDQDFLPQCHAPGRGPDMMFEFEDYILVVEVTLTTSSRQEAAEGEPVRRHVAEIAQKYEDSDKRVYCLFIAVNIDSNTAETFKIGNWYKADDTRLPLQIVPMRLDQFIMLLESGFNSGKLNPSNLMQLLVYCRSLSNRDAPEWKTEIAAEIKRMISTFNK